jgi:hypothetical protein
MSQPDIADCFYTGITEKALFQDMIFAFFGNGEGRVRSALEQA